MTFCGRIGETIPKIINHNKYSISADSQSSSKSVKVEFGVEDSYKLMKTDRLKQKHGDVRKKEKQTKNCLNLQMLRNSEKLTNLRKKMVALKESLSRNPG